MLIFPAPWQTIYMLCGARRSVDIVNTQTDPDIYKSCERAFLRELAKTVTIVVERTGSLTSEEKTELVSSLTFAIASHLSGSSFGGRVTGDEIYPKLGFWKGENDDVLYLGDACKLQELVPNILNEVATENGGRNA